MDAELLQKILTCPALPSLPAVAVRVLELTSDPDVKLDELAETIENDQALVTKILRTVNSSFYGLRKRCTSIDKALVMLGLGPVKSLVLGFSLVSTLEDKENSDAFDYQDYWRRALHTAIAGKLVADVAKVDVGDEAFLGGLLQDIGMIATHRAIPRKYKEVLELADGDHRVLVRYELEKLEMHHADIGAALAERWRLPPEIVNPIKYHERPTACPTESSQTTRCVALGFLIHMVLVTETPAETLRETYRRAKQWLGLDTDTVDELIRGAGDAAKELSTLFELDAGSLPNPEDVLAEADRQLREMTRSKELESFAVRGLGVDEVDASAADPLTGLLGREGFTRAIGKAFLAAHAGEINLTVVQFAIEGLGVMTERYGPTAGDEVMLGTAVLLVKQFEPMGGIVTRIDADRLAVVLPQFERRTAGEIAQLCCTTFDASVPHWLPEAADAKSVVWISAGGATLDQDTAPIFQTPEVLIEACNRAVAAAQSAGHGCYRGFVARRAA